jgi:hypothetical protein
MLSCSDPEGARRVLEKQGYSQIQITGYKFFGCSKGDTYRTGFKATAPNGSYTSGVVCKGWFKGNTVRLSD